MHLTRRSSLIYGIFTVFWALVILVLSTMPGNQLPQIPWLMTPDKFGHAAVYAVLTIGLYGTLRTWITPRTSAYLTAAALAATYGISMEVVQFLFFPGRYFEFWDIVANIIGAFLALLVLKLINY
jgi:VanZ family protein